METEAVEEHLLAEDVHLLHGHKEGCHTGANNAAKDGRTLMPGRENTAWRLLLF